MFLKLKKGKQKEVIQKAIDKAGSERKLCKYFRLSNGALYRYKSELGNIPNKRLESILTYVGIDMTEFKNNILKEMPNNWGRVKGGINCVAKKRIDGVFKETVERLRKASSKRMKEWHTYMKKEHPKEYHLWQYERFKKIGGGYKYRLINDIQVRNPLEKEIGDFLILNRVPFEYEAYVNIKGKAYFPDFKINNLIIEVTEWKHHDRNRLLMFKRKIDKLKESGFEVVLFIPNRVRKFYKGFEGSIVSTLPELKEVLMPS